MWGETEDIQLKDFRQVILDLKESENERIILRIADEDYQGFDVKESTVRKYCAATNRDYWQTIMTVAGACHLSDYVDSSLSNVFIGLKADDTILTEHVPLTLPQSSFEDNNGTNVQRTFQDWYQNPPGKGVFPCVEEGKILLATNVDGVAPDDTFLYNLSAFVAQNPNLNIEYLTLTEFKEQRKNPEVL